MYFSLSDVKMNTAHRNAFNVFLKNSGVSKIRQARHIHVEGSKYTSVHKRERVCNFYHIGETLDAINNLSTSQRLVNEAKEVVLEHIDNLARSR